MGYTMPPDNPANSGQGMVPMGGTRFSPAYGYAMGSNVMNSQNNVNDGNTGFDPMFGAPPTNTFSSHAGWQGEDGQQRNKMNIPTSGRGTESRNEEFWRKHRDWTQRGKGPLSQPIGTACRR
ncbi:hypothetical protein J3459_018563 [Metarhizium acridum]|nr:hypothetical protein J3459_018563 [Metarhizium acridum]